MNQEDDGGSVRGAHDGRAGDGEGRRLDVHPGANGQHGQRLPGVPHSLGTTGGVDSHTDAPLDIAPLDIAPLAERIADCFALDRANRGEDGDHRTPSFREADTPQ